jgi:hypothetical protein
MSGKKILSIVIKAIIGIGCLYLIYHRISSDLTVEKVQLLKVAAVSGQGIICLVTCLLLIPVNWGIEVYKWQLILKPLELLSYRKATQSVYSGVCVGNLAPGRATEFIGKVLYVTPENRPQASVLHFVNGMFQLSITIITGLIALMYQFSNLGSDNLWMLFGAAAIGVVLLLVLVLSIVKIEPLLRFVIRKFSNKHVAGEFHYGFEQGALLKLFALSFIRYLVFFLQFVLLIYVFHRHFPNSMLFSEIAIYFLVTSTVPMISAIEAPVRAVVALMVFRFSGINDAVLTLTSALIWLINIILPSIPGYFFLLRQNFNFKILRVNA